MIVNYSQVNMRQRIRKRVQVLVQAQILKEFV